MTRETTAWLVGVCTLTCSIAPAYAQEKRLTVKSTETHADFLDGDKLVARYHYNGSAPKPYFHPINGPFGASVTRGYPMERDIPGEAKDHRHHRAAWFTHGDVIPEGMTLSKKRRGVEGVDFWAEGSNCGRIVFTSLATSHPTEGTIITKNEWQTADGQKIMDETRAIIAYDVGESKLFVVEIDLHASVCPITFGDTKEGSFGVRVAGTMKERSGGVLENADGKKTERNCWGQQSDWCDYSGTVDGKTVGIAILDDPGNQYRACWHSRGYGLMAANPFGRAKSRFPAMRGKTDVVKLAQGEHLRLRYGILVHPGNAEEGKVAEHYKTFVKLAER